MSFSMKSNRDKVIESISDARERTLNEVGSYLSRKVSGRAPVDTGELRDSVGYDVDGDNVIIGAEAVHSKYIEFGTSKAKAQPFLEKTVRESVDIVVNSAKNNMSKL